MLTILMAVSEVYHHYLVTRMGLVVEGNGVYVVYVLRFATLDIVVLVWSFVFETSQLMCLMKANCI